MTLEEHLNACYQEVYGQGPAGAAAAFGAELEATPALYDAAVARLAEINALAAAVGDDNLRQRCTLSYVQRNAIQGALPPSRPVVAVPPQNLSLTSP